MRKSCFLVLTTILMVLFVSAALASESGTCGIDLTWTLDDNGLLTISGTGEMEDYYNKENGVGVWVTTAPWGTNIQNVVIKEGVTSIGQYAFFGCESLKDIIIPDGLKMIGSYVFYGCRSLSTVTIPESVTSIGGYAFANCINLNYCTIPDGITGIQSSLFESCYALSEIDIPASVTSIGEASFSNCRSITEISIPDSVTTIGARAFLGCSSLTGIVLPESVTYLGNGAFNNCSSITSIYLSDNINSIGNSFRNCSNLTEIKLPRNLTEIGNFFFYGCSKLSNVTIPDGVIKIGEQAFWGCLSLTGINIPDGVESIGKQAFQSCISLTSITIPPKVTKVEYYTFANCRNLRSVSIPESVVSIDESAFSDCDELSDIVVSGCDSFAYGWAKSHAYNTNAGEHKEIVKDPAVEPTCTEEGLKEGSHCASCGEVIVKQETIPAKGHKEVIDIPRVEATCSEAGFTEQSHCSNCGATLVERTPIPAKGHTIIADPYIAPSGNSPGWSEGAHCSVCGYITIQRHVIGNVDVSPAELDEYDPLINDYANTVCVGQKKTVLLDTIYHNEKPTYDPVILVASDPYVYLSPTGDYYFNGVAFYNYNGEIADVDYIKKIANYYDYGGGNYLIYFSIIGNSAGKIKIDVHTSEPNMNMHKYGNTYDGSIEISVIDHLHVKKTKVIPGFDSSGKTEGVYCPVCGKIFIEQRNIPALNDMDLLQLPGDIHVIKEMAFENADFQAVIIPNGCTEIDGRAFANCKNLIYVQIPQSISYVAPDAFEGCGNIIIDVVTE